MSASISGLPANTAFTASVYNAKTPANVVWAQGVTSPNGIAGFSVNILNVGYGSLTVDIYIDNAIYKSMPGIDYHN